MQDRKLGGQGLAVSSIGYGSMGISFSYGPSDEQQGIAAIRRAFDQGITFFDTAEIYGWGANEELLGRAVKDFRDEVVIATKFGFRPDSTAGGGFGVVLDSRPEHIRTVVDNSLRLLGTDCIDLLYQHRVDPNVPIEDVVGTMAGLVAAGKVKFLGLSEAGPGTLRKAHAVHPISALQSEYSLFAREIESLLPTLEELGVGLVAYSPLARGFLTGARQTRDQFDDSDARKTMFPWWQPGNYEKNLAAVEQIAAIAQSKGVTVAQLALAWLLARKDYIVPIPGSRNPRRVDENAAAAGVRLTQDEVAAIGAILPSGAHGLRILEAGLPVWE